MTEKRAEQDSDAKEHFRDEGVGKFRLWAQEIAIAGSLRSVTYYGLSGPCSADGPCFTFFEWNQASERPFSGGKRRTLMNNIIYIVGLVVIVIAILSFLGLT